ncbi:VanZ family protein [Virgibacillus ainsalahensis]
MLLILWIIFIFIATCTQDVHAFLAHGNIHFNFTLNPDWDGFLQFYPLAYASKFEFFGHVLMFFVFTCLLRDLLKHYQHVILLSINYAFLTEFIQVYFGRGADFYDVIADVVGVFLAVGIAACWDGLREGIEGEGKGGG